MLQSGYLAEALRRVEQAKSRWGNSPWDAPLRIEEAKILLYRGQSLEALKLLDGDWTPKILSTNAAIDKLLIVALASSRIGNRPQANASVATAEAACSSMRCEPGEEGEVWSTAGILAFEEGRLADARNLFARGLEKARASNKQFLEARDLVSLSAVSLEQYHYEDALSQSQTATEIANRIGARQTLVIAQGNAGWAYYETGDYARALASFNAAAEAASNLGATLDQEHWLDTAGMSEARLGNFDAARDRYDRALVLARSLENKSEIAQVDQALASLLLHTAHLEQAEKYINEARTIAEQAGSAFDISLGNLLAAQLLATRGDLPQAKSLLMDVEQHSRQFPTTQVDAQHTLAQVCDKAGDREQAERWFQRSIATYHSQRSELHTDDTRLPFSQNGRNLYMDYVAFLIRNHRMDDALNVIDQGRAETLADGLGLGDKRTSSTSLRRISLTALARQSRAVILVYALSPQGSYLWAANGKQSGFYTLPDRAAILTQVANHRRSILAARDLVTDQRSPAHPLYDMLVKPAEHLIHHGDRVFIVADDRLNGLNFETLLTPGESSHYWIEDVIITQLPSLRLITRADTRRTAQRSKAGSAQLLVIGDPVYSGQQYSSLPHAADEISDVAAHFPDNSRTVLSGASASPAAYVRSDPGRYDYIHFVSHAVASELVPLDSAVILSAQGSAADTGKLYARDILSKPLRANLVTISACQGAGVRAYAGEGLVGLAWAFLRAGSHNVIGALWDVSDASTPELMQHLYDGIAAGQSPDASLHAAKLEMLHSRGIFRKPIYWGAFQLYSSGQ
jgi:CHAT domain-containing protein/tetratricopeptide (TPR) repeat protein